MSELFGGNPKIKPAKDWGPAMQGQPFSIYKDGLDVKPPEAAPAAPAPSAIVTRKPADIDALGKAARQPTILTAPKDRASPAVQTYGVTKLG